MCLQQLLNDSVGQHADINEDYICETCGNQGFRNVSNHCLFPDRATYLLLVVKRFTFRHGSAVKNSVPLVRPAGVGLDLTCEVLPVIMPPVLNVQPVTARNCFDVVAAVVRVTSHLQYSSSRVLVPSPHSHLLAVALALRDWQAHHGAGLRSGHYTADVQVAALAAGDDDRVYRFNDGHVCTRRSIDISDAYMLLLRRRVPNAGAATCDCSQLVRRHRRRGTCDFALAVLV